MPQLRPWLGACAILITWLSCANKLIVLRSPSAVGDPSGNLRLQSGSELWTLRTAPEFNDESSHRNGNDPVGHQLARHWQHHIGACRKTTYFAVAGLDQIYLLP